jgi:hypothetical protein
MRNEVVSTDITIIGGGLSGVCAAIAAARLGRRVALVQNRPVLGGNASSEVRVWVGGANGLSHNRYARESGIMGELQLENLYRNQEGNPYIWDLVVHEAVMAEPNIQLFLNTDVRELQADGEDQSRTIRSVTGWMMGSERLIRFESPLFMDCTGDGLVGFLAGAQYRNGREARSEFNEPWAPEQADQITLGSTIFFHTKRSDVPVPFERPAFARDITQTSIPVSRILSTGDSGAKYWWIEFGGEFDTVHDDARIRDELWSAIYGIWDYIKNSGKFDADHLTLEWVGAIPGKRESRRFVGDYTFTQNDVIAQKPFEDRIGFGGWMVDLHPPKGMYTEQGAAQNMYANGIFHIPFRCLYSVNVGNLLMAGRNISASHAGFGATRVMATCAVMGEAAGTAAALCQTLEVSPRTLAKQHIQALQQQLLAQDASLIGVRNSDAKDLARQATVQASSWLQDYVIEASDATRALDRDIAFLLPVDPRIDTVDVLVDVAQAATLTVELWATERAENYVPHRKVAQQLISLQPGTRQWLRAALAFAPDAACNACVILRAAPGVAVHLHQQAHTGTLTYVHKPERVPNQFHTDNTDAYPPAVLEWNMTELERTSVCFRVSPATQAFAPSKLVNGYARPYRGPNCWSSAPLAREEWISLTWPQPVRASKVAITFNDDVHEHLNNLHKWITPFRAMPELVKDYRIEARVDGAWQVVAQERGNRRRHRVHALVTPLDTDAVRLVVESTQGALCAEVFEIRVY